MICDICQWWLIMNLWYWLIHWLIHWWLYDGNDNDDNDDDGGCGCNCYGVGVFTNMFHRLIYISITNNINN